MNNKLIILVAFLTVVLAGCKTEVKTVVSASDLLKSESKTIEGRLDLEVTSCADFDDSRKPSKALTEAQQKIPNIFTGAEFVECYKQKFDTYAGFKIPIYLNKEPDSKNFPAGQITLNSYDNLLLSLTIPKQITEKIELEKKQSMGMSSFEMEVYIKVDNDTGDKFPFTIQSSYIDEVPYVYANLTSHKDSSFVIKLSDVMLDAAMSGENNFIMIKTKDN